MCIHTWMIYEVSKGITYIGLAHNWGRNIHSPTPGRQSTVCAVCVNVCCSFEQKPSFLALKSPQSPVKKLQCRVSLYSEQKRGKGSKRKGCEKTWVADTAHKMCSQRIHDSPAKQIGRRRWECGCEFCADRFSDVWHWLELISRLHFACHVIWSTAFLLCWASEKVKQG